jgi:hypothetical protein
MWTFSPAKKSNVTTHFHEALEEDLRQEGRQAGSAKHQSTIMKSGSLSSAKPTYWSYFPFALSLFTL